MKRKVGKQIIFSTFAQLLKNNTVVYKPPNVSQSYDLSPLSRSRFDFTTREGGWISRVGFPRNAGMDVLIGSQWMRLVYPNKIYDADSVTREVLARKRVLGAGGEMA